MWEEIETLRRKATAVVGTSALVESNKMIALLRKEVDYDSSKKKMKNKVTLLSM
jgi:hypothetical protein